ncbi:DUF4232 domain-containing protein [Streptomyces sp. NBC_00154]|uniref:DUF4232 domain-containing protein n=1 Tax=Streptomyces sp. NBC_00154 TaxID=2975670 RepID=UPI0022508375|nr:DUF4232 domain-containing protein [Streptomyces sp. NBC_00154]MCX5309398.1 DUF4232 domain-containing protein [Streptomyces sp. NBC_00154]
MSGSRRKAFLVSAVLVGGAMLMTACQDSDAATDTGAAQGSSSATPAGSAVTPSGSSAAGSNQGTGKGSDATGKGSADGGGADTANGEREPVGQSCGANDISWSTRSETQAGGYILIIAKAKSGITCYLPAALPTVAFGSDGTEAGPAEQTAGKQIKLSGSTTAYAGVNPKTTNGNGGKELDSIIVAIGDDDPNPVSLPVGTITVDHPIVTNWHTAAKDAVPFS